MGPLVAYGDKKINDLYINKIATRPPQQIAQIKQKQTKNLNIHDDINIFFKQLRPDTKLQTLYTPTKTTKLATRRKYRTKRPTKS